MKPAGQLAPSPVRHWARNAPREKSASSVTSNSTGVPDTRASVVAQDSRASCWFGAGAGPSRTCPPRVGDEVCGLLWAGTAQVQATVRLRPDSTMPGMANGSLIDWLVGV